MNLIPKSIIVLLVIASQNISALTISVLENLPLSEVHSKILKEIYNRADIPLEFVVVPAERSLALSTRGIIDGELVRVHKVGDLHPTLIRVPTSYTFFESRAFSKIQGIQKDIQQDGWSALQGYRVGIIRGMKYAEPGLREIKNLVAVDSTEQLFKMLELNRIDIAIASKVSGLSLINEFDLQSIHLLEPPLQRHDLYHYLHEENKQHVSILDETIRAMIESGELVDLEEKFTAELLQKIAVSRTQQNIKNKPEK